MEQKQCTIGLNCGSTCIQKLKMCREDIQPSTGAVLDKAAAVINAVETAKKPDADLSKIYDVKNWITESQARELMYARGGKTNSTTKYGDEVDIQVDMSEVKVDFGARVPALEIGFKVNGQYYKTGNTEDAARNVSSGFTAMKLLKNELKRYPDGTLLYNEPYAADGSYETRKNAYEKLGFGNVSSSEQYGVKFGDKIYPITDRSKLVEYYNRLSN